MLSAKSRFLLPPFLGGVDVRVYVRVEFEDTFASVCVCVCVRLIFPSVCCTYVCVCPSVKPLRLVTFTCLFIALFLTVY